MNDWVALAPAEVACLAGLGPAETCLLDRLVATAGWLRDADYQARGATDFAARRAANPQIPVEAWAQVAHTVRDAIVSRSGAGLVLIDADGQAHAVLVGVHVSDGFVQVAFHLGGASVRRSPVPPEPRSLADELGALLQPAEIQGLSWSESAGPMEFHWTAGSDVLAAEDALAASCEFLAMAR